MVIGMRRIAVAVIFKCYEKLKQVSFREKGKEAITMAEDQSELLKRKKSID